jgi:hypothetical protein
VGAIQTMCRRLLAWCGDLVARFWVSMMGGTGV